MDYKKPQSTLVQGSVGIYPLTTADQVILEDGSRLEKDGKISADSAGDSAKLGGKAPEYYIQPRNLLDNSDFTNPVKQAGLGGFHGAVLYAIDRWLYNGVTSDLSLNDGNGILYATNKVIYQLLNENITDGIIRTLGIGTADGKIGCVQLGATYGALGDTGYQATHNGESRVYVKNDGATSPIIWAALYEGSYTADTLPPYVPKGYAAELAECRRYAKHITGALAGIAHGYASGKAYATIFTSGPKMRIVPSVDDYSKIQIINGEYYSDGFTSITGIATIVTREDSITFWIESSEISAGKDYYISCEKGVLFSSDL